ncbi:MAG: hypothetical protein HZB39_21285 [Planctomycetes bacterium]|nr:hypothetical protein [Planctomycetota bacterium]
MTPLPDLTTWLAGHPVDDATLALSRHEVKAICDELARLRQSNDLLRKQNRKVRGKVARLRGGEADLGDVELDDGGPTAPA